MIKLILAGTVISGMLFSFSQKDINYVGDNSEIYHKSNVTSIFNSLDESNKITRKYA